MPLVIDALPPEVLVSGIAHSYECMLRYTINGIPVVARTFDYNPAKNFTTDNCGGQYPILRTMGVLEPTFTSEILYASWLRVLDTAATLTDLRGFAVFILQPQGQRLETYNIPFDGIKGQPRSLKVGESAYVAVDFCVIGNPQHNGKFST